MSKEILFKDIFVTFWHVPLAFKDLVIVMLTPHKLTLKYSGLEKGK